MKPHHPLHELALKLSRNLLKAEAELMDILEKIDREQIYLDLGYTSLYAYATGALRLSENNAYQLIHVGRKTREVPELRTEIQKGTITISKAKRIVPVLTRENHEVWLHKASTLTKAELEREVVQVAPETEVKRATLRQTSKDRASLSLSISLETLKKMKRVQSLLISQKKKSMDLEATLNAALDQFLFSKDPVEKAKRAQQGPGLVHPDVKENIPSGGIAHLETKRLPLPASLKHQVFRRDQGKCRFRSREGLECLSETFIELHHKIPVSRGGPNTLANIITVCGSHHRLIHT